MIISRTPVRVSFFGGGTDYREYYERESGAVLGTTINKYIYVSLNELSDFFEYKIRVAYSKSELVNSIADIVHPSVRECLKFMNIDGNLDIHIFSDLPAKTGLGSSSAFSAGFLHCLYAMKGKLVSKQQLAAEVRYIEQQMIHENVGSQDQYHTSFGGLNIIEFNRERVLVRPVVISREKRDLLEKSTMVFYTGLSRFASEVVKEQIDNTKSRSKDSCLKRMGQMVFEAEKIISDISIDQMMKKLGELLHEGWELKKTLSGKISNSSINDMYSKALEAGAYGGKISGAGAGGFLMLFVDPACQKEVRRALSNFLELECRFEDEGSQIIYLKNVR